MALVTFCFGYGDGQDAVLDLGRDLILHHIVWQRVALLVVRVAVIDEVASPVEELAAQIVMVLVLMLVPSVRMTRLW